MNNNRSVTPMRAVLLGVLIVGLVSAIVYWVAAGQAGNGVVTDLRPRDLQHSVSDVKDSHRDDHKPSERAGLGSDVDQTRPIAETEDPQMAHVRELLDRLLAVEVADSFFYDMVKTHFDKVIEVMAFLQKQPDVGIAIVSALYAKAGSPRQKALLVFIASAARDSDEALKFFRAVMADQGSDPCIRTVCAYALGMANMPIEDVNGPVRWHYATVLWAAANLLRTSHPAQVYVGSSDPWRMGWPRGAKYAWQGSESKLRILQVLMEALNVETCLRTRHVALASLWGLEDRRLLIDLYQKAYLSEDWAIPEGHFNAGVKPVRGRIVFLLAQEATKTRDDLWINALKWLQARVEPWESGFEHMVEPLDDLGLIDKSFVQKSLYPFSLARPREELIPVSTGWMGIVLERARQLCTEDEFAPLLLSTARGLTKTAECQIQLGYYAALECLRLSEGLATETEICRVLLRHPSSEMYPDVVEHIARRGLTGLVPDLESTYWQTTSQKAAEAIREGLARLAPEVLARLPERKWPTYEEHLAEMVRSGEISQEDYETMLNWGKGEPESE